MIIIGINHYFLYFCVFVFEGRIEWGQIEIEQIEIEQIEIEQIEIEQIEIGRIKIRANCHSPLQHTHDTFAHTYIRMNIWPTHVVGAKSALAEHVRQFAHTRDISPTQGSISPSQRSNSFKP